MNMDHMTERAKDPAELAELLKQLPTEDRLKVEGVAVGLTMARSGQAQAERAGA